VGENKDEKIIMVKLIVQKGKKENSNKNKNKKP
jgi:hypothetical protein